MKILYLDCFSGISGDMAVGALVDAGVPLAYLRDGLAQLGFGEQIVRLETRSLVRSQIHATKLDVIDVEARRRWLASVRDAGKVSGDAHGDAPAQGGAHANARAGGHDDRHGHAHAHEHEHSQEHAHGHEHDHAHEHGHGHAHEHGHEHEHGHDHAHEHGHGHDHAHVHGHGHDHAHGHDHGHEHTDTHKHNQGHAHEHGHAHAHEHDHDHAHEHDHDHGHEHADTHEHKHTHVDGHEHGHAHAHGHSHDDFAGHRSYAAIRELIGSSALPERVRQRSLAIFREIGIAEARVHDVELEHVHFHEVGAVDSIADIVAFALCLEYLGIDAVHAPAIPLGSGGFIETQHGTMPLPAPATLEILKGYPVQLSGVPFELTTPTGAGIIKALARGPLALETLSVERIGFGAGTRELSDRPNLLRAIVGERLESDEHDLVTLIECSIDDLSPQVYPHLFERLLAAGAHDVYLTPVLMKKGRPGHVLTVTADAAAVDELTRIIFVETTTIGVRYSERTRRKLARREVIVETEYGRVRMKQVELDGGRRTLPELDEARRIALARSLPLQTVLRRLQEIAAAGDESGAGL